ncbi:hypothetical protein KY346_01530 [Candidatus Woesearchaeota archaeon]|nr:hypothetical protein [Candidatus Woesearchaeota archaeon]
MRLKNFQKRTRYNRNSRGLRKIKHILKCNKCEAYTMKESCKCGGKATTIVPAKYSPQDKYAEYRRKAKGLI